MLKSNAKCFVNSEGQIINILEVFSTEYEEGSIDDNGLTVHSWDASLNVSNPVEASQNYYWDNDISSWSFRDISPSPYHIWVNKKWELNRVRFEEHVRKVRNILLTETDWTQLPDSPLSDTKKTEWQAYRQSLRDITNSIGDISSLDEIVWPSEPE